MPKLKNRLPKMCRDRNQAISWYKGKRIFHGRWNSDEAKKSYKRFIAALLEDSVPLLRDSKTGDVLVSELVVAFMSDKEPEADKTEFAHFKRAVGFLVDIYGDISVNEFSPKKLKVCRRQMVKAGTLSRRMVNQYTTRIVRIFAWGEDEDYVSSNIVAKLRKVKRLRKEEQGTFDNPPREDVPDEVVERTLFFMRPMLQVMVIIQRQTGCRPSEVCGMTVGDIIKDAAPDLWYFVPASHKTERFIGKKALPINVEEQALIAPYLEGKKPTDAVFSPRIAQEERHDEQRANRKTKITPSQEARNRERAENPANRIGEFYDSGAYRKAIEYAIRKGNKVLPDGEKIPHWTPYQLRHTNATEISRTVGKDEARAQLAHTSVRTTEIYDHSDLKIREELARNRKSPFTGLSRPKQGIDE